MDFLTKKDGFNVKCYESQQIMKQKDINFIMI
jgi:hypothetical protein